MNDEEAIAVQETVPVPAAVASLVYTQARS